MLSPELRRSSAGEAVTCGTFICAVNVEGDGGRTSGVSAFAGCEKLAVVVAVVVVVVVVVGSAGGDPPSDRGFGIATSAAAIYLPQTDRCLCSVLLAFPE